MGQAQGTKVPKSRNTLMEGAPHSREAFSLLAQTFQALGDTRRVQIVYALTKGEKSVGVLAECLGVSQPAVSHHLRTLRNLRLVRTRKEGRNTYYALDDHHIDGLMREGLEHVQDLI